MTEDDHERTTREIRKLLAGPAASSPEGNTTNHHGNGHIIIAPHSRLIVQAQREKAHLRRVRTKDEEDKAFNLEAKAPRAAKKRKTADEEAQELVDAVKRRLRADDLERLTPGDDKLSAVAVLQILMTKIISVTAESRLLELSNQNNIEPLTKRTHEEVDSVPLWAELQGAVRDVIQTGPTEELFECFTTLNSWRERGVLGDGFNVMRAFRTINELTNLLMIDLRKHSYKIGTDNGVFICTYKATVSPMEREKIRGEVKRSLDEEAYTEDE
jgi:hypothetical protein